MKKFIITSTGYSGEVHIVYGIDGLLMLLDFSHAKLNAEQVKWFKEQSPTMYLKETFTMGSSKLTVVESGYEITLEMFWEKYNRKVNLKRFTKLWNKAGKSTHVQAYFGITAYDNHLAMNTWKNKADPETYFKNEYWLTDWSKVR